MNPIRIRPRLTRHPFADLGLPLLRLKQVGRLVKQQPSSTRRPFLPFFERCVGGLDGFAAIVCRGGVGVVEEFACEGVVNGET
jgi:hypothetical protein